MTFKEFPVALRRIAVGLVLPLALGSFAVRPAQAQARAGEVTHLQGMATAQQPGGAFRFLAKGDAVLVGDTLSTTEQGYAVVTLSDGTKYTLRPSTSFLLEGFEHGQGKESLLARLLKGGVRVVTGLTGKLNPAGVELRTSTSTVGIRGTSYDARLCGADCRAEGMEPAPAGAVPAASTGAPPQAVPGPVAARVVQLEGQAIASTPARATRTLAVGAALFEGEDVRTAAASTLVLGFRDQTRVSVNPATTLRIASFSYQAPARQDQVALRLLKGGIRSLTGLIGKAAPEAIKVQTATSTLGARGTGMDISCEGPCSDPELGEQATAPAPGAEPRPEDGLFMYTWEGLTYFERGPLDVPLDRSGFIGADGMPRVLASVPAFFSRFESPRPDRVDVDWQRLFASTAPDGADGLYVYVREGHVFVRSGDSVVDLGPGEAGYSGRPGEALRLAPVPGFLSLDPFPIPEFFSGDSSLPLQLFGVMRGPLGGEICRI